MLCRIRNGEGVDVPLDTEPIKKVITRELGKVKLEDPDDNIYEDVPFDLISGTIIDLIRENDPINDGDDDKEIKKV